ncbi:unnamed protein product [Brassica napus]|uniref:proline--tRNA ligase n=2 Tax=Brassica napus TaxID=3708 RepID=A0A816JRV8_BRANA|nr:unnamed protein product [Brassica napus]
MRERERERERESWNILRSYMDAELEKLGGVEEKKFPMLIKRDSLEKEKDHIEGVMAMTHGDEKGVVLPPKVARYQVVVVPVPFKGVDTKRISQECQAVKTALQGAGVRALVDERDNYACGWKYADWEMKGVPLRIELGPRDLEKNQVRMVRRDTGAKMDVLRVDLVEKVKELLEVIQRDLYDVAKRKLEECIQKVETWDEFKEALRLKKLVLAPWCDEVEVENDVKENTKGENEAGAKTLCTPFDQPELREDTLCFASGKPAKKWTYWGRSY